jgi:hypothetical protein
MNASEFQESIDTLKIKFEGGNSIDAELFTRTINNIIELIKASAAAIDPHAILRIELNSTNKGDEGAFTTVIDVVAMVRKDSSGKNNITSAFEIVSGFLSFLQIKSHLNGRKPKSIA